MARDMTKGNITGHLIAYAVPLVFGNLFQQLYHTVDSVVVGQFYGKEALAAVRCGGSRSVNILTFLIGRAVARRINSDGKLFWCERLSGFKG